MVTITPEQRRLLEQAGDAPVRIADAETDREYVILRADVYDRMRHLLEEEEIDPSFFEIGDFEPVEEDPR
jgi:hypothetical protein